MEFPEHGGLIPGSLEKLRECDLCGIEGENIIDLPVQVTVLPCKDSGPGWSTDGVGYTGVAE